MLKAAGHHFLCSDEFPNLVNNLSFLSELCRCATLCHYTPRALQSWLALKIHVLRVPQGSEN